MSFVNGMPLMVLLFLNLEVKLVLTMLNKVSTYQVEIDEQTGFQEKVITESKKQENHSFLIIEGKDGEVLRSYSLPLVHTYDNEGDKVRSGKVWLKSHVSLVKQEILQEVYLV